MKRYLLGFLLAVALLATPASGVGAQGDAGCDTLSAAEAQTLLDSQPTYANRDLLDPDGDGVACEADELAAAPAEGCDPATAADTAAADPADDAGADANAGDAAADPAGSDDAKGGTADVSDPCDPATARGGSGNGVTVNGLPSTGAGAANPAILIALLAAASALGGVGIAAASRHRARA